MYNIILSKVLVVEVYEQLEEQPLNIHTMHLTTS